MSAIDRELAYLQERAGAPKRPNLGCSTIAHDRLGFCAGCVRALRDGGLNGWALEATCWQLLALRDQSQTSTSVDAQPAASLVESSAQQRTDAGSGPA